MKSLMLPHNTNYIAAFLTLDCNYSCAYCINKHGGGLKKERWMDAKDWIKGLNRIRTKNDLPITIQGGEPTGYEGFYEVVNGITPPRSIDLLTNGSFDLEMFTQRIPADKIKRAALYASIRVSYHPGQGDFYSLIAKVKWMQELGYSVGIWEVEHPKHKTDVSYRQRIAQSLGIDYRVKEFLGPWKGELYGTFAYDSAVACSSLCSCLCRISEMLIGPDGYIFRCHNDLYTSSNHIGHILDTKLPKLGVWRPCTKYGQCNACDVKITTDRFQKDGHTSVEIKDISPLSSDSLCQ